MPQPLQLLVDLGLALSAITGLYHYAPAASHSSHTSHATSLTPDARLHFCALETTVSSWASHTDSQNLTAADVPAAGSSARLPWLPPLCVCLQLAPATTQIPAAGFPQPSVCSQQAPAITAACLGP